MTSAHEPSEPSRPTPVPIEVLVVGGGPVGLMMAAELHRHGVPCRLVERLGQPALFCKALGITPRTLEVWDDLGIAHSALNAGLGLTSLVSMVNGDVAHAQTSTVDLEDGAYGFLTLAQYDTERILAEHLATVGGRIERGVELIDVRQTADSVQATLRKADGTTEKVTSRHLVGCDGGRSSVRHALKIAFEGEHYEPVFFLADVELDWPLPRGPAYKFGRIENDRMVAGGACIPVPGNPRRYRFSTTAPDSMVPPEIGSAKPSGGELSEIGPTLSQVQSVLDSFFPTGAKASNLRWSSFYRISHRLVSQYRVGRIFLAGDAAHLHPPLGGQGMNTGIQDAYNLAWKLALEVRGQAATGLLDSYHAERHVVGQDIVQRTADRMNRVLEGKPEEPEPVRADSQLFLHYRTSAWIIAETEASARGPGPLPGDRAPDVSGLQRPQMRSTFRLFDLLRGPHHTLLAYTQRPQADQDFHQLLKLTHTLQTAFQSGVQTIAITPADDPLVDGEGLPCVADVGRQFARVYGAEPGRLYLVRPDGYIGCRAFLSDRQPLYDYLQRVFRTVPQL